MNLLTAAIIRRVTELQGCKATELAADPEIARLAGSDFVASLMEAVESGEVVEIEYTLPNLSYRVKSFLLPKGTSLRIVKQ